MGRYSKIHSNYVTTVKHQNTKKGAVWVRDFVTIGSQHQIERGKKPYYSDTNFLFTVNSYPSYKKKHNYGKWVANWDYDDVRNATPNGNNVVVNTTSNDIRDFAYYGSAVELVRSSILNIIGWFPARVTIFNEEVYVPNESGGYDALAGYYQLNNPFDVDFVHELSGNSVKIYNEDRFLTTSWKKYMVDNIDVSRYTVVTRKLMTDGDGQLQMYPEKEAPEGWKPATCKVTNWMPVNGNNPVYTVTINDVSVEAYIREGETIFLTKDKDLEIKPRKEMFDEYFRNLDGFERQLLTLSSKPVYKNSFLTPIEGELSYKYVYREYVWPSTFDEELGYGHIDISSQSYVSYVQKLYDMATVFDELWCDNLYRNMTHESIKNFDWTFTREYSDGDEQDNIDGGNRVMQLLRIYGRAFDDVKRLADGIGLVNSNTYDGFNNQPEAEITDRLRMGGWDIVSTIPTYENVDLSDVAIDSTFLDGVDKQVDTKFGTWFNATNPENFTAARSDIEFMRRLLLSSKRILQTKGTKHSIDMVMGMFGFGDGDYGLTESYYYTTPKPYDECVDEVEDLNYHKNYTKNYDDIYSGVPLNDIYIGNGHYIVPYMSQYRMYDGGVVFESKGGWGKRDNGDYTETLSYLHVVGSFSELLNINANSLNAGDIYYVTSLVDYTDYVATLPENLSHFFCVSNGGEYNPQLPESWENVDLTSGSDAAMKAMYLDSIISSNEGNNPHVGYGRYDEGKMYREYMEKPFKYGYDEYLFDYEWMDRADKFEFKLTEESCEKAKVLLDDDGSKYYLNRKYFVFENKLDSDLYKDYFKNVIMKYVMQVIPSTTILILKNFE